jgi:hypothetical protein
MDPMSNPTPGNPTPGNPTPARRKRHLMDPNNPVRMASSTDHSLTRVQRWVMSVLVVTTMVHLIAGLVIAAAFVGQTSGQIGLLLIAATFGVLGGIGALAIHGKRLFSPWIFLGVVPSLVGALWIFG